MADIEYNDFGFTAMDADELASVDTKIVETTTTAKTKQMVRAPKVDRHQHKQQQQQQQQKQQQKKQKQKKEKEKRKKRNTYTTNKKNK